MFDGQKFGLVLDENHILPADIEPNSECKNQ